ncbi:MAG TPA: hypothetical protein V6D47_09875 [Oscillatoriaceae cyanobacterium]
MADLERPHAHAYERVGFLLLRRSQSDVSTILQGVVYLPVADEHYIVSQDVGAIINANAIRAAMQAALSDAWSVLHVHLHNHGGRPHFSPTDFRSLSELVPSFFGVAPGPHGALVFSRNKAACLIWTEPSARPEPASRVMIVGFPMKLLEG